MDGRWRVGATPRRAVQMYTEIRFDSEGRLMRMRYLLRTSAKNVRIRRHGSVLLLSLLVVLLAWLLAGCFGSGEGDGAGSITVAKAGDEGAGEAATDTTDQKPKRKEKAIKVNVGEVVRGRLVMPIYADGTIRTPRSLQIRA